MAACAGITLFGISVNWLLPTNKIANDLQKTVPYEFEEFTFNLPKIWLEFLNIKRSESHANIVVSENKNDKLFCMYTSFKELDRYQSWLRITHNMREEEGAKIYKGVNFGSNTPLNPGAPHLINTIKFSREGQFGGVMCALSFKEQEKELYLALPQKILP